MTWRALAAATLLALAALPAAAQDVLVPRGAPWRYLDDGSDQGTLWTDPSFVDGAWPVGRAEFGFGDGDEVTLLSFSADAFPKPITTYYRHEFVVANPAAYAALELRLLRDAGAVVHLNGVELARSNMPPVPVLYDTRAAGPARYGEEAAFFPFYLRPSLLRPGRNVLAVELHLVSFAQNDGSFDLELTGHAGPTVVRGPYVQLVTGDAATVRFRTIVPTLGRVWYGPSPTALVHSVSAAAPGWDHELRITGLTPGTRYHYAVGDASGPLAGGDADHWFRTAPPVGSRAPFRAWILGDAGTFTDDQRRVRDAYLASTQGRPTDLMLFLGDNAYALGDDQAYQLAVFEVYDEQLRNTPSFSTRGNHEYHRQVYLDTFTLPDLAQAGGLPSGVEDYYSFDWGNVHFVCLDSTGSDRSPAGPMYRWCAADLASTNQDWIVAFFHHPPYSKGSHDSDWEFELIEMRENFGPLLEDHGVALVLSGHSHSYERSYLLDGHQGDSTTFDLATHALDPGDGREDGTGAYLRTPGPHAGAVYVVAGSSGQVTAVHFGQPPHPAMVWTEFELGSVVLDVTGGRMDVTFLDDLGARRDWFTLRDATWGGQYCVGAVNGEGCVATLSTAGSPSVSSGQPFVVRADGVRTGATSMLFYGTAPSDLPVAAGRLCVAPPAWRTQPGSAGGAAPCSGVHAVDFAPLWGAASHPALVVGTRLHCQLWYRDTTPAASSLSEALVFTIEP